MSVRVMVADDERVARNRLTRLLSEVGDAEVVAECADGASTIAAVKTEKPDVLFLDIEMPEGDGFDVASAVTGDHAPMIVFVTAFDQYAVRAFEVHAADYLLKPFGADRLAVTWQRVRDQLSRGDAGTGRVLAALDELKKSRLNPGYRDRLLVNNDGRSTIIKTADIEWIEAAANYVKIHVGKAKYLLREPLTSIEGHLDPQHFIRIHRSAIVNLDFIAEIQPWFSGDQVIILRSGERVKLSRTFRKLFEERVSGRIPD
jgi:two-component system LytT family response regulator